MFIQSLSCGECLTVVGSTRGSLVVPLIAVVGRFFHIEVKATCLASRLWVAVCRKVGLFCTIWPVKGSIKPPIRHDMDHRGAYFHPPKPLRLGIC